jgi:hypothetical protein
MFLVQVGVFNLFQRGNPFFNIRLQIMRIDPSEMFPFEIHNFSLEIIVIRVKKRNLYRRDISAIRPGYPLAVNRFYIYEKYEDSK